MNVSNISSTTNHRQTEAFGGFGQRMQDFKGLANALIGLISLPKTRPRRVHNLQNSQGNWKQLNSSTRTRRSEDFQVCRLHLHRATSAQDAFATFKQTFMPRRATITTERPTMGTPSMRLNPPPLPVLRYQRYDPAAPLPLSVLPNPPPVRRRN
jgi:hypothetical protein